LLRRFGEISPSCEWPLSSPPYEAAPDRKGAGAASYLNLGFALAIVQHDARKATKASTSHLRNTVLFTGECHRVSVLCQIDKRVRLYSRPGNDLTYRFPLITEALLQLQPRSCIIDGEAVSCGADGIASFDRIRYRRRDSEVFLYAFDLVELNGDDLRRDPLEVRKATLERLLARAASGLRYNEHLDQEDGPLVFLHACK
jgi:hypothetical protein